MVAETSKRVVVLKRIQSKTCQLIIMVSCIAFLLVKHAFINVSSVERERHHALNCVCSYPKANLVLQEIISP